ncbi:MAG: acetate--CoA ligase family protein [Myxococcota bacterium]|nr:acetate--CoA ligase family protein [Myxococcota bacterium]
MDKIFYPKSVAVIGLSSKASNIPRIALENMLRWGYRGRLFGVNPRSKDVFVDGVEMYQAIEDLPEVPDLAYCLIPAQFIPDMVTRCGQFGIKRMAIPSGGFSEFGAKGQTLAELTKKNAREQGIRFVGPNGLTVANTANGLCLPFAPVMKPPRGGISIIAQSGGIGLMLLSFLKEENLGLAKFASIGNKLDLDEVDFLEYLGKDPDTQIICMYIESIARGRAMIEVAQKIDKPIVVYKSNTTGAGKKAAMSHTAAVSNDDAIIDCAFERAGVIRIREFYDFFAIAKAFQLPPMRGRRLMVMSPAGGLSVMMADMCEQAGFEFADPGREFYDSLNQFTNAGVIRFSNPLDMGDIYDPQLVAHVICAVMHSDRVDGAVYASFSPQMPSGDNVFKALLRTDLSKEAWGAILSSGKPLGACLASPSATLSSFKQAINVPIFNGPEEMIRAMAAQMRYHTRKRFDHQNGHTPDNIDWEGAKGWLMDKQGQRGEELLDLFNHFGIPTVSSTVAQTAAQAAKSAGELDYPVVAKVISPDALHKTDAGGVITGLTTASQVKDAFATISQNLKAYRKDARFDGVRIQKMAPQGIDLFIGGHFDPAFGSMMLFGMGGIHMELFKDIACALCPVDADEIKEKLSKLKCYGLLKGFRGSPGGDIGAFIDIAVRISHLLSAFPSIVELDANPVRVFESGATVLDARARIE